MLGHAEREREMNGSGAGDISDKMKNNIHIHLLCVDQQQQQQRQPSVYLHPRKGDRQFALLVNRVYTKRIIFILLWLLCHVIICF